MKFTLSWLKQHLDTNASAEDISIALTSLGLEVESVTDHGKALEAFITAEIQEATQHPQADRLRVCKVNNGKEVLQIVCGAPNARAGIKVVLASIGVNIPNGNFAIKKSAIRGVESNGMLCSAEELMLGLDSEGIMELPASAEVGKPFAPALGLDDVLFDIAITPNRGDCLGVRGVARELAAKGIGTLKPLAITTAAASYDSYINVSINTDKASLFIGRYIRGVKNAESPDWLKQRLTSIGLRPISALVDITNFLTHDLCRPAHVFDAKKIQGNITVRESKKGETLNALNDKSYELPEGLVVIADDKTALGLGGVVGGVESGCTLDTTDVFLEIALFDPIAIATAGRALQIDSDARHRFERGLDGAFALEAAEYATWLITQLCGGEPSKLVMAGKLPAAKDAITLRKNRVATLAGVDVTEGETETLLKKLGFSVAESGTNFSVTPPSWRNDISLEADLVEEVVRLKGYDSIPEAALPEAQVKQYLTPIAAYAQSAKRLLATRGYSQVISYSFMSSAIAEMVGVTNEKLRLANPISSELDMMRSSVLPNLLEAVKRNSARGAADLALFEVGNVFTGHIPGEQKLLVTGIKSGAAASRNHYGTARAADLFDTKADLLSLIGLGASASRFTITRDVPSYYHPGKAGAVLLGKNLLGYFGELHPELLKKLDIETTVVAFELFAESLPLKVAKSSAKPKLSLSNLQNVERDFAFLVDKTLSSEELLKSVRQAEKSLPKHVALESVSLFDIYEGKGVEPGKKSVAFGVTLQPLERTLTDVEIEQVSTQIIESVKKGTGGALRS